MMLTSHDRAPNGLNLRRISLSSCRRSRTLHYTGVSLDLVKKRRTVPLPDMTDTKNLHFWPVVRWGRRVQGNGRQDSGLLRGM